MLTSLSVSIPVFESIKVVDATDANWEKLLATIAALTAEYETINNTSIPQMWDSDLDDFENGYRSFLTMRVNKDDIPVARVTRRKKGR
jgi:hypothetical protein